MHSSESRRRRRMSGIGGALVAAAMLVLPGLPAAAVEPDDVGVLPTWQVEGSSGAWTATGIWPESSGIPATTITSDATSIRSPSGVTAFLGDSTDFGAEYGSTRAQPYLNVATAAGQGNSTSSVEFGAPTPSGWGFALGDVDADWVFVRAWSDTERTQPLSVEQLGFRSSGNSCENTPKPGACEPGPHTDAPVWVTSPETFDGVEYVPGTLRGSSLPGNPQPGLDTSGAYGWFQPTVPVQSMEFLFGKRDGFPVFQLWMAAPAPKVILEGEVTVPDDVVPPGTGVQVNDGDGEPVLDIEDQPLTVPVAEDGTFEVELPQDDEYELAVIPTEGYEAPDPVTVPGTPEDGTLVVEVPEIVMEPIAVTPTPTPTPTATPSPTPSPTSSPTPTETPAPSQSPSPTLPATGWDASAVIPWVIGAVIVVGGGATLLIVSRRRGKGGGH